MTKQKYIFLSEEGDRWFGRNRDKLGLEDPVTPQIAAVIGKKPRRVLEIGCANGWRLAKIRDLYGCEVVGIEPSMTAAMEAATLRVPVVQSTASSVPLSGTFDLIIFGFCLYLTDPDDWLLIAAENDRLLEDGGHIIIHDFPRSPPHGVPYKHHTGITSWHYDWPRLWLGHPAYQVISETFTTGDGNPDQQQVTILRKNRMRP